MPPDEAGKKERQSLKGKIKCSSTDCKSGLHCFIVTKKKVEAALVLKGSCQTCGAGGIVDWERVRKRDPADLKYTLEALKNEFIRHYFWCVVEIDQHAINHARRKGRLMMLEEAKKRITKSVGAEKNYRENFQTPWKGRAVYYAQHGTATCCRRCIEQWHGIEPGRDLTNEEVAYLSSLVTYYIDQRIPLSDLPEKVPPIRKKK
jgi:hypothetical protein